MLDVYLKLVVVFMQMIVWFANSEEELVTLLNTFSSYCKEWKLDINFDKAHIMVFDDQLKRNKNIVIGGFNIKEADTFKGELSNSFTNYNNVGNTKVSVSIKKTYANKCTLSEIFLTEILKSFSGF